MAYLYSTFRRGPSKTSFPEMKIVQFGLNGRYQKANNYKSCVVPSLDNICYLMLDYVPNCSFDHRGLHERKTIQAIKMKQFASKPSLPWIILMSDGLIGAASIFTWTPESPSSARSRSFSLKRRAKKSVHEILFLTMWFKHFSGLQSAFYNPRKLSACIPTACAKATGITFIYDEE